MLNRYEEAIAVLGEIIQKRNTSLFLKDREIEQLDADIKELEAQVRELENQLKN